jgi:hypothetical protein
MHQADHPRTRRRSRLFTASPLLLVCLQDPNNATRSQSEQSLLEFRRSAGVEAALAVLQQSGEEAVQFQAGSCRSSLQGRFHLACDAL